MPQFAAIVVAAGASRRTAPRDKLTAVVRGVPMLRRVVDVVFEAGADEVVVVLPPHAPAREATLRGSGAHLATNPDPSRGMASSIAVGARALLASSGPRPFLLTPADMPHLAVAPIHALVAALREPDGIAVPVHRGERGHPVLFGAAHAEALATLHPHTARDLIAAREGDVVEVALDDPGILVDIDTPADLAALETPTGPDRG